MGTVQVVSVFVCDGEMGCAIAVDKVDEEGPEFERPAPRMKEHGGGMIVKKAHPSKWCSPHQCGCAEAVFCHHAAKDGLHFTELEWHRAAGVASKVLLVKGATNESCPRMRTKTIQPGPGSMRLRSCARRDTLSQSAKCGQHQSQRGMKYAQLKAGLRQISSLKTSERWRSHLSICRMERCLVVAGLETEEGRLARS